MGGEEYRPFCRVREVTDPFQFRHGEDGGKVLTDVGQVVREEIIYVTCGVGVG